MIAEYALTQGLTTSHVAFATGEKFPDGLAAAPYLALNQGILLLTKGAVATPAVAGFLSPRAAGVRTLEAIGLSAVPAGPWLSSGSTEPSRVGTRRHAARPRHRRDARAAPSSTTTTTARPTTTTTTSTPPTTTTTTTPPTGPRPRCRHARPPRPGPATTTTTAPTSTTTTVRVTSTTVKQATTTTTASYPPIVTTTTLPPATTPSGVVSVRDYGAKGDGTADDIGAIWACITAAAAADKEVYFPAGTYKVSDGIWLPTG